MRFGHATLGAVVMQRLMSCLCPGTKPSSSFNVHGCLTPTPTKFFVYYWLRAEYPDITFQHFGQSPWLNDRTSRCRNII